MAWEDDITAHEWSPGDVLPSHNDGCMICGSASDFSPLRAAWRVRAGARVGTTARFDGRHQGAPHYAHGGAVAALLDDAMGYVSFLVLRIFVTANLTVDYRRPVLLEHDYDVAAWCEDIDGRKVRLRAELRDGDEVIAEASGLFIAVDVEHFRP